MTTPHCILLLDSNAADRELALTLLGSRLPQTRIVTIDDSLDLATALTRAPADVAIIAPDLEWAGFDKVLSLFAREAPGTAIVLFGGEERLLARALNPGRAINGIVRKDSAGFVALADVVCAAMPPPAASTLLEIDQLPVAAAFVADSGHFSAANARFVERAGVELRQLAGSALTEACADDKARETWLQFLASAEREVEFELGLGNVGATRVRIARDPARAAESRFILVLAAGAPAISVVNTPARDSGNREMHDVALVFSHDLKEPVQQINRLVHRLGETRHGDDPGERQRLAGQLTTCAERASAMLDGMLEYLAVTARDELPAHVDLNECLEAALENLRAVIDETGAQIISARLPVVAGDAYQLLHLFQNLIGNAIKFRGHDTPRIRISVTSSFNEVRLEIADNGIGIAPAFCEQVFDMGKRLHTRDEYPGGGIGLTLCRRIVERHGGKIHIEPGVSGGSLVVITLPQTSGHKALEA